MSINLAQLPQSEQVIDVAGVVLGLALYDLGRQVVRTCGGVLRLRRKKRQRREADQVGVLHFTLGGDTIEDRMPQD